MAGVPLYTTGSMTAADFDDMLEEDRIPGEMQ